MLKVCPESSGEASVLSPNVLRVEADSPTRQEDVLSTLTDGVLRRRMSAAEAGCCGWPRPMRQENVLSTPTDGVLRLRPVVAAEAGECPEWVLRLRPRPTRQENVLSARRARRMS